MMLRSFDHFLPEPAHIAAIVEESEDTRTCVLKLDSGTASFDSARPGQFAMLSVLGHGEAAFTLSSLPGFDRMRRPGRAGLVRADRDGRRLR